MYFQINLPQQLPGRQTLYCIRWIASFPGSCWVVVWFYNNYPGLEPRFVYTYGGSCWGSCLKHTIAGEHSPHSRAQGISQGTARSTERGTAQGTAQGTARNTGRETLGARVPVRGAERLTALHTVQGRARNPGHASHGAQR